MVWIIIGVTAAVGLYMAWTIGANDVANSMGPVVGSRAVTVKQAIIIAGICELAGAVLVGSDVTNTIRKGIVEPATLAGSPEILCLGMACALLSAALWLHLATIFGMPVSTSHSIVGAVVGFGIVAAGWGSVYWGKMGLIVLSWFTSPVVGLILGFLIFKFITRTVLGKAQPMAAAVRMSPFITFAVAVIVTLATIVKGLKHTEGARTLTAGGVLGIAAGVGILGAIASWFVVRGRLAGTRDLDLPEQLKRVEGIFVPLAVISSCTVAFAHGANDVANAIGPLAAVVDIAQTGSVKSSVAVPLWVLILGGVGIVIGLATYGHKVMLTIGSAITEITASRAVAVNIAASTTVLACTRLGLPVSTSHTIVGAVLGVGFARGIGAVNKSITKRIFTSWLLTVPAAAIIAVVLFSLGQFLGVDDFIRRAILTAPAPQP